MTKRLAILASGAGSTLAHIHQEVLRGAMPSVEVRLVLSNNSASGALEYARTHEIPSEHVSMWRSGGDTARYEADVMNILESHGIQLLALAGYLKKAPEIVLDRFQNRTLNVHPALLPSFGGAAMYGRRVHEAVLERGCKISGATVHLVTSAYDAGPIVAQACCDVRDDDTAESLGARVQQIERTIYPPAIELAASDAILVEHGRVRTIHHYAPHPLRHGTDRHR